MKLSLSSKHPGRDSERSFKDYWVERVKVAESTGQSRLGRKDGAGPAADVNLTWRLGVFGQKNCTYKGVTLQLEVKPSEHWHFRLRTRIFAEVL